jgi:hypothetical protein
MIPGPAAVVKEINEQIAHQFSRLDPPGFGFYPKLAAESRGKADLQMVVPIHVQPPCCAKKKSPVWQNGFAKRGINDAN